VALQETLINLRDHLTVKEVTVASHRVDPAALRDLNLTDLPMLPIQLEILHSKEVHPRDLIHLVAVVAARVLIALELIIHHVHPAGIDLILAHQVLVDHQIRMASTKGVAKLLPVPLAEVHSLLLPEVMVKVHKVQTDLQGQMVSINPEEVPSLQADHPHRQVEAIPHLEVDL